MQARVAPAQARAFILRHTRLQSPPHAPELRLHLADEALPLWRMTEEELQAQGVPPPFWAFAWAGGQALARWVLDNPAEVAGKRVLDFATGSGLCAVAAMRAGAAGATGCDIDPFCEAALGLNAAANGVEAGFLGGNLLTEPPPAWVEVILAGDIAYEQPLATDVRAWLRLARDRGARVLIGDPGRAYFETSGLERLAEYRVPTTRELEDQEVKRTGVWAMSA